MGYLAIAYPCGCTTNDEFTASRKTCEHGNSYHMARSVWNAVEYDFYTLLCVGVGY